VINFEHPSIVVEQPAPGHYAIRGHNPGTTFVEGVGHVVPPDTCYITPQVPSELLIAILQDRGQLVDIDPEKIEKGNHEEEHEEGDEENGDEQDKPRRGRPRKNH
jgi:hypothetical protein